MILKNMSFALLLCGGLLLMGSAAQAESVKTPVNKINPDGVGEEIGFITFSDADGGGVDIIVDLTGLPEGEHGMHVHENASCAPAEKDGKMVAGLAAGGHYDPMKTNKHAGPDKVGHKGDLPHIMADAEGVAKAKLHAPNLQAKDLKGHSVMIHEGGDNYTDNPPLGGGGARIACGVIK